MYKERAQNLHISAKKQGKRPTELVVDFFTSCCHNKHTPAVPAVAASSSMKIVHEYDEREREHEHKNQKHEEGGEGKGELSVKDV